LSTLFWKHVWLSEVNSEQFPRAFSFVVEEDVFVQHFLSADRLSENFFLPLSPQAFEEVQQLQQLDSTTDMTLGSNVWTYP
jgi:hypothetical protein